MPAFHPSRLILPLTLSVAFFSLGYYCATLSTSTESSSAKIPVAITSQDPLSDTVSSSSDTALVKQLLAENLSTRRFSFPDVIASSSGKNVLSFDEKNDAHIAIKSAIDSSIRKAMIELNASNSPIKKLRRINEASRYFEDALLVELNKLPEIQCEIPKNAKGKQQRSGYPDLLITHKPSQTHCYLDPKLYEDRSENSSLRTFYYEPKKHTLKVQHNAIHLLLGIKHDGNSGNWQFLDYKLVDLSKLNVKLKAEFQASNKDMYRKTMEVE